MDDEPLDESDRVREIHLSVHTRRIDNDDTFIGIPVYEGFVYVDSNVVYEYKEPAVLTPAGLDDFTGVVVKKFARSIQSFIQPSP